MDDDLGRTPLSWLQRTPTGDNPKQILETLDKIAFLQQHQVNQWNLAQLNPNRINHLARIGARATNQYLQRANEAKRYPILVAFLKQSLYNFTDDLIEMVDQRIWKLYGEAKRNFEQDRLKATETINEKLQTLYDLGQILLNPDVEDHTIRTKAFEQISQIQLQTALGETKQLIRPQHDAYVDYFGKSYQRVRHFSNRFLATLQFQSSQEAQGLLKGLQLVREIHSGIRRKVPDDAPTGFVPEAWLSYVVQPDGIDRRYYELAALWVLRQELRSGAIYLFHSRRFSELESYFIPKEEWVVQRDQTVNLLGTPLEPQARLAERETELFTLMDAVETLLNDPDGDLREEKGELILSPIEAQERSAELKQLAQAISTRLPQLDIPDLLIEVDGWTGFSDALKHLGGSSHRDNHLLLHLYGSLLAQACNLELKQLVTSAELSYPHLSWCNTWYIREDTLREANNVLVNYHYRQPLSQLWGGGMLSSSDGQRFPVKGSVRQGRALPRYFGYGKGITFYSWTLSTGQKLAKVE
ncbi:MAG: transposase [Leptolyngbyaceae cyanobacterium SM1_4_3]|nr:transposase [Leptolyngbyaceae cyanobacterium SM1_4_3]